ncbi:MAG: GAF domain-containing protein, partial [Deltaproteobacteria bacterium]|nr:GAF domain-containing protein [Deltaproteobacteria bacterium]
MKFNIRIKLIAFTFCIILLVGGSISLYFIYQGRQRILETFKEGALQTTTLLSGTLINDLYFLDISSLRHRLRNARVNPDISRTYVMDSEGILLTDGTGQNPMGGQKLTDNLTRELLQSKGWVSQVEDEMFKVGLPLVTSDGVRIGHLQVGFSLDNAYRIVHVTTRASLYITLACLIIGAALAFVVATGFSRPIESIVKAALAIGQGRLDTRLPAERKDELGVLARSINQMAESLQSRRAEAKRLFNETQRNLEGIRALHEIDIAINSTLDLKQVLDVLLEKIELFLPYSTATIRLLNKESSLLEPVACRNLDEAEWKVAAWKPGRGPANAVFESKAPLVIRNCLNDPRVKDHEFFRKHQLVSYLGVPMFAKEEILGVLSFYTKEEHEFTAEEVEFLTTLAGQAAVAIHNARLHEETERRRREAEELARVAQSLTETLDMRAIGERIVTSVRELFGVSASTLRLLQPDGLLRTLVSTGESFSQTSGEDALPAGIGLASVAVAEGRPIWSADVLNEPRIRLTDRMRGHQLRSGDRSMIAVPLRVHGKIIGALGLADQTGRTYSDSEVALVQTFADQAALALENARLY